MPATPSLAVPCRAWPRPACLAMPSRARPRRARPRLPCPATPRRAAPCLALPALPCRAAPGPASPAMSCHAEPRLATPALPCLPCPATPCPARPRLARPRHALPGPAAPCHAYSSFIILNNSVTGGVDASASRRIDLNDPGAVECWMSRKWQIEAIARFRSSRSSLSSSRDSAISTLRPAFRLINRRSRPNIIACSGGRGRQNPIRAIVAITTP